MSYPDNKLFQDSFNKYKSLYDDYIQTLFDKSAFPEILQASMRYSLFAGGKRVRPVMVLAACDMFGGDLEQALPVAAALEMIHTYSLIHDDLPAMDDDDLRRGKPTNHKMYGEAMAILAGDTLMTYAYETIADGSVKKGLSAEKAIRLVKEVGYFTGANGMAGGQVLDLEGEHKAMSLRDLLIMHSLKTGALIKCCIRCGAIVAGVDEKDIEKMTEYAEHMGILFQVVDDILDVTSSDEELGKPVGSDEKNDKTTFVSHLGIEKTQQYAKQEADVALKILSGYQNSEFFVGLIDYFLNRSS